MLQVKGLLTWVWKDKQIYMHTPFVKARAHSSRPAVGVHLVLKNRSLLTVTLLCHKSDVLKLFV